jgi:hypothetical protein
MRPDVTDTQRRGRRIAMTAAELDAFLSEERVCRVATQSSSGAPHVSPLWFVWDGTSLWIYSIVKSQRWTDLARDPRAAVVIDAGHDFGELRGAELQGSFVPVGETPRTGAEVVPDLETPERLFGGKYGGGTAPMRHDQRHGWLRLTPEKVASWDFRKMSS